MRKAVSHELCRRSIRINNETSLRIEDLKHALDLSSDSEVIRQALRYFEEFVGDHKRGGKLIIAPVDFRPRFGITIPSLKAGNETQGTVTRRSLLFHRASIERLKELMPELETQREEHVISIAVLYLARLAEEISRNSRIYIEDRSGQMAILKIGKVLTKDR